MPWTLKANLRGPAGQDATDAAQDDAALAAFINAPASATRAALLASLARKAGGNTFSGRSTFHQPPAGGEAGLASHRVDNNGAWVAGQLVAKSDTVNAGTSVFDWSNVDPGAGYLFHLVAGTNMGGGLIGIGADGNTGTGLVISAKGAMTGMGITNTATSSGVGFAGGNFGTGLLVKLEKGNATANALLSLRGFAGGTAGIFKWRNAADTADLGWIEDSGEFNLASAAGHRTRIGHGAGFDQRVYTYSGAPGTYWTTAMKASTNTFQIQAGQSAAHAQGAEALTTLVEVKSGARLGFYGAAPVTKPAAIASPAADVAALKTAVDALRTTLTSLGLSA